MPMAFCDCPRHMLSSQYTPSLPRQGDSYFRSKHSKEIWHPGGLFPSAPSLTALSRHAYPAVR